MRILAKSIMFVFRNMITSKRSLTNDERAKPQKVYLAWDGISRRAHARWSSAYTVISRYSFSSVFFFFFIDTSRVQTKKQYLLYRTKPVNNVAVTAEAAVTRRIITIVHRSLSRGGRAAVRKFAASVNVTTAVAVVVILYRKAIISV